MPINIKLPKPKNPREKMAQVARDIRKNGGVFSGDDRKGSFSGSGIRGVYEVGEDLRISITVKPFFLSEDFIEKQIRRRF